MSDQDRVDNAKTVEKSTQRTVLRSILVACGMFAFGFAMVPLYRP